MGIYKKVFVAIDPSSESWHALKESIKIIRNKDTWAVVVTVPLSMKVILTCF